MKFTKMHGCGNDYIYINGSLEQIPQEKKPELVRMLSDRHFGVGGDGVIFINPSEEALFEMEMYNGDGSRGEMCGNGIRCVAKYVYDKGLTDQEAFDIISAGQVKHILLQTKDGKAVSARVNMGQPELTAEKIPVRSEKECVVDEEITVQGEIYHMTCVSMGNPHAVVFVEDVQNLQIENVGPYFERHERFPKRINTEFVHVNSRDSIDMRVWERGAGETLACGTGCCASVAACVLNGLTDRKVTVHVPGGAILIEWDQQDDSMYMTGPAVTVFEGEIDVRF
ncbi:MAG: diaminopimelate epimerase [Lachnospiraceae bacterium]|jgi:diaminopimelate epimerase|nr:diaminopimelate epimerase [Lachnospiraceae bacterium]